MEFNHKAFQDEVSKVYTLDSSLQTLNAKSVLDELFNFDRMVLPNERNILKNALSVICENDVGNMIIKLLYQNRDKIGGKLHITTDVIPRRKRGRLQYIPNAFDGNRTIHIVPATICKLNTVGFARGHLVCKEESLDSVLFHELGHAFHYLMGTYKNSSFRTISYIYDRLSDDEKRLWHNDEEFYNITGYFYDGMQISFDPLNCNMYDICKQCKEISSIDELTQRIFHYTYDYISYWLDNHGFTIKKCKAKTKRFLINLKGFIDIKN